MSKIITNKEVNFNPIHSAFKYQEDAFLAIKDLPYSAIFHEQGLGKTKIAIDLSLYWLSKKDIDTVLIVTKKQLVNNWEKEFKFHTHIKPVVLNTNKANNYYVLNGISKVIITNFETVCSELERIKLFLKCRNVAIIIDESAKIKNPDSITTKNFFEISDKFKIKVIMSGTPVANRPYDIWSQIYFLDKGKSLGNDFETFKKQCDLTNKMIKNIKEIEKFELNVSSIYDKIKQFTVRETKKSCGINLPTKNYFIEYASFEEKQYKIYTSIINNYSVEIIKNNEVLNDNDEACLKRLLRLNQVASNPALIDDSYCNISGKEKSLLKLVNDILDRNEKVIIWSNYVKNIEYFYNKFNKFGAEKLHGEIDINIRNKSIDRFKNDPNCKILLATPQAAKEGLTLTVANNAIFYDRTFNLDDYLQAQDRIHRISQTRECNIYLIMIKDSIDEWIDALIRAKQSAAFLAQGDITIDQYSDIADYSYAYIIKEILKERI